MTPDATAEVRRRLAESPAVKELRKQLARTVRGHHQGHPPYFFPATVLALYRDRRGRAALRRSGPWGARIVATLDATGANEAAWREAIVAFLIGQLAEDATSPTNAALADAKNHIAEAKRESRRIRDLTKIRESATLAVLARRRAVAAAEQALAEARTFTGPADESARVDWMALRASKFLALMFAKRTDRLTAALVSVAAAPQSISERQVRLLLDKRAIRTRFA